MKIFTQLKHAVFMIVFLYLLLVLETQGKTTHSVTGCSDTGTRLNCSNNEMIDVERITFYSGTDCNQAVADLQVCGKPITGNDSGLAPACTGKTSCHLFYNECPGSKAAKLDYRCIPGNDVKDMCDEIIIDNTNRIFLSTPNYPSAPNFTDISPCICSIRGSNITSIQILELVLLTSNDGTKSSLEINYGDVTYNTESFNVFFNERLSTSSTTAEIILNHNGINEQLLWIEIQGVSMHVFCNDDSQSISTTLSSTLASTLTSSPFSSSLSSGPTQARTSALVSEKIDTEPLASSFQPIFQSQVPVESNIEPPSSSTALIPTILSSSPSTRPTPATSSKPISKELTIEPISSSPILIQTPDSSSPELIQTTPSSSSILIQATDSSSSPTPDSSSPTADIKCQSQDKATTIIILAVLLSLCLLIICLATISIIVVLRRKKLVWMNSRESNVYSGLDPTLRSSENDGTYLELNDRNSTPQDNVSQYTHNDYQHVY